MTCQVSPASPQPRLRVDGVGQRVDHGVQVGRDVQTVEDRVVAGVDDGGDLAGRHHLDQPAQQPGRPHAAGQRGDHRRPGVGTAVGGTHAGYLPHRTGAVSQRCREPARSASHHGEAEGMCKAHSVPPERLSPLRRTGPALGRIRRHPAARLARPGSASSARARSPGLAARRDVEVSAFAVSWRRRKGIEALVPRRCRDPAARHAGPAAAVVPGGTRHAAAGRVVHRPPRRRPRLELRRATDRARRPGGDRPRPDRRPLPGAVRPTDARLPRARAAARRPRAPGCTRRRSSWPTRWWPSSASTPSGSAPSTTACRRSPVRADAGPAPCRSRRGAAGTCWRSGTVEPRKDYPLLVSAFDEVAAGDAEVALVIVGGDGWGAERLTDAVEASPARAPDRARRVPLDDRALAGALRHAAVLAYPSLYEGFGFPPLQAMAVGVPVVATAGRCGARGGRRRGRGGPPRRRRRHWPRRSAGCSRAGPRSTTWWRAGASAQAGSAGRRAPRGWPRSTATRTAPARRGPTPVSAADAAPRGRRAAPPVRARRDRHLRPRSAPGTRGARRGGSPRARPAGEPPAGRPPRRRSARRARPPRRALAPARAAAHPGLGPRACSVHRPDPTSSTRSRSPPSSRAEPPWWSPSTTCSGARVPEAYPRAGSAVARGGTRAAHSPGRPVRRPDRGGR